MNKTNDPNREVFEQSYRNFLNALEIVAKNAEEQCHIMGWYNVAWELRDDISNGRFLLKISHQYLSDSQQNAIYDLLMEIEKLPEEIFGEAKTEKENISSMRYALWDPIRAQANNLIKKLKPITVANEYFFKTN